MAAPAVFLSGSLLRHVTVMSLTSSVGLMAVFAVDFVDMVFIALLGNDALAAALGYAATVLFFTNFINLGLANPAGSLVARARPRPRGDTRPRWRCLALALGWCWRGWPRGICGSSCP